MKKYKTPEIQWIKYDTDECLTSSTVIGKEDENIDNILGELGDLV